MKFKFDQILMLLNSERKYFKYSFLALLILITTVFFLLNHSFFIENNRVKNLDEFQIETKNIHSIFIQQFKNRHLKKNLSIKKGQSLNSILLNADVLPKDIFDATRLLSKYLNAFIEESSDANKKDWFDFGPQKP